MYDPIWNLENLLHGSTCGISQPIPLDSIIEFEDAPQDEEPFEFEPFVWHSYRDPPTLLQDGDKMRPLPFDSLECSQTYPSRIPSVTMTRPDPSVYIPIHDPQTRPYLCPYYEHDREKFVACQKVKYKAASHIRQHIRTTHLKKSVWCPQCGTGFGDNDRLTNRHDPRDCKRIAGLRGGSDSPQVRAHIAAEEESFFGKISKKHLPIYPKDDKARYRRAGRPLSDLYSDLFTRCSVYHHFCEPRSKVFVRKDVRKRKRNPTLIATPPEVFLETTATGLIWTEPVPMVATEQHSLPELQTLMDSNELDATTGLSYQRAPMMNYDLLTAGEPTTFFDESFYEDTALSADDLCNFFEDGSC